MAVERLRSLASEPEFTGVNPGTFLFAFTVGPGLGIPKTAARFGSTGNQVLAFLDRDLPTLALTPALLPRQFLGNGKPFELPSDQGVANGRVVDFRPLVGTNVLSVNDQYTREFQLPDDGICHRVVSLDPSRAEQPRIELFDPPSLLPTSLGQKLWTRSYGRHTGERVGEERYSWGLIPHAHFEESDRGPFIPNSWMLVSKPTQSRPGQVVRIRPTRTDPDLNSVVVLRQTRPSVRHVGSRCGRLDLFAFLDDRIMSACRNG